MRTQIEPSENAITYSVNQVSELLGISRTATYDLIAQGKIPAVKLTEHIIRIDRAAFQAWWGERVAEQRQGL